MMVRNAGAASADWLATDEIDAVLKVPVCRAATKINKTNAPAEIAIAVPKDKNLLPVVYLSFTGLATRAPGVQIRFAKNDYQPAYLLSAAQTAGEPDVYWYAPRDLAKLIDLVKNGKTLDVVFDPKSATPVPVRFSLGGSTAALAKTATCSQRKELLPVDFLKALHQQVPVTGVVDSVSVLDVLALTNAAFADFLSGKSIADALAGLRKAMKPLTDKEAKAMKLQAMKQAAVDTTTANVQANQSETTRLEAEVARSADELSVARGSLANAQSDLAAKKVQYDAGRAALAPFEKDVRRRESVLDAASNAVAQARSDITRFQSHLRDLEAEASRVRGQANDLERSLSSARADENSARAALGAFDERQEIESALRSHWRYNSLRQTLQEKRQELHRAEGEVQDSRRRLASAEAALNSCRAHGFVTSDRHGLVAGSCDDAIRNFNNAQAGLQQATAILANVGQICGGAPACILTAQNNYNNAVVAVRNAQAEKDRACANEPPRPTPPPPPDCRRQEEAVRQARYEYDRDESRLSSLRSEIDSVRNQLEAIESEVRAAVASRRAALQQRYDSAVARTMQISQDLASVRSRLGEITGSEIPSYESALSAAKSRLPDLVDREADAERDLQTARRALADQRRQIGFDATEAAYTQATRLVRQIEGEIAELGDLIARDNSKISKLRAQLPKLQASLAKQNQELEAAKASVTAIQTQLAPQRQQESAVVAQLELAKAALHAKRADYQARIQKLNEAL